LKDKQYNGQKKTDKKDKTIVFNTPQKTQDGATQTLLNNEVKSCALEG